MTGDNVEASVFEVIRAIRKIIRRVSLYSKSLATRAGLTVPQILCLKAIHDAEEEVTLAMIGRQMFLSPATVTGIIDRLEKAELVVRQRSDKDRRKVIVTLTEKGLARLQDLPTPLQDEFVEKLSALREEDRDHILMALQQVVDLLGAAELEASPILVPGDVKEKKVTPPGRDEDVGTKKL